MDKSLQQLLGLRGWSVQATPTPAKSYFFFVMFASTFDAVYIVVVIASM